MKIIKTVIIKKYKNNKAAPQCAMAHKVQTPPVHNFGIIVYQKTQKSPSIFQKMFV